MKWLLFAISTVAMAQTQTWVVQSVREKYDESTDLGKAMNICAQHRQVDPSNRGIKSGVVIRYDDGWEDCNSIHAQWEQSIEGQQKAFIKKFVK